MAAAATYVQTATERVFIGRPAAEAVAEEAKRLGARRVFMLVSRALNRETDEIALIAKALGPLYAGSFDGMPPHGPRASVLAATAAAREAGADLIVSVGGGSVTDAAKVMTICLKHNLKLHEDMELYHMYVNAEGAVTNPAYDAPDVRVICVPTTLSGGEFNTLSGATDERIKLKQGYEHRMMAPVAIVLDPAITVHTPEWLWLSTGVRALDHAIETLGSFQSNYFCDSMAESALKLLSEGLTRVKADPRDLDGRLKCQIGAWQSMIPVIAGVPMGLSHATGHALGGTFDVPHGHTSCVMAPFALAYNASVNGERQARIVAALGANEPAHVAVDRLIRGLGMPRSLGEVGIGEADLPRLADAIMHDIWARTNPRPVASADQVVDFLKTAL
ncbi:MAG: iron-containing alcohol dehydrogenase [Parvibaculum sp.]|uniref:iron-containing alcohol dehydrogenase n=1 Tax=Parvibaculum sp. TaxID=2024848 RepID=UPI0025E40427|nr:iron-containing alcohol dehydrogenase [Parvibaculum sp.]MCE9650139.1 iron-containing alcohol dehydrogenase [Parvibaculum sp.]